MLYVFSGLAVALLLLSFYSVDELQQALASLLGVGDSGPWLLMGLLLVLVAGIIAWRWRARRAALRS